MQPQRVAAAVHSPVAAQPHNGDRAVTPEVDEADPPPLVVGQHDVGEPVSARAPLVAVRATHGRQSTCPSSAPARSPPIPDEGGGVARQRGPPGWVRANGS
jgi:hypothetical protein